MALVFVAMGSVFAELTPQDAFFMARKANINNTLYVGLSTGLHTTVKVIGNHLYTSRGEGLIVCKIEGFLVETDEEGYMFISYKNSTYKLKYKFYTDRASIQLYPFTREFGTEMVEFCAAAYMVK